MVAIGSNVGVAIAPLIVLPIAVAYGWRTSFYVNGILGLIWVVVCIYWFRNDPSEIEGIPEDEKIYIEKNRRINTHAKHFHWAKVLKKSKRMGTADFCLFKPMGLIFFNSVDACLLAGRKTFF